MKGRRGKKEKTNGKAALSQCLTPSAQQKRLKSGGFFFLLSESEPVRPVPPPFGSHPPSSHRSSGTSISPSIHPSVRPSRLRGAAQHRRFRIHVDPIREAAMGFPRWKRFCFLLLVAFTSSLLLYRHYYATMELRSGPRVAARYGGCVWGGSGGPGSCSAPPCPLCSLFEGLFLPRPPAGCPGSCMGLLGCCARVPTWTEGEGSERRRQQDWKGLLCRVKG